MNRQQGIVIGVAIVLFVVLFYGFDIIPPKQKALEKSRAGTVEATSLENLLKEARPKLNKNQTSVIDAIQMDLDKSGVDTIKKIEVLKALSGTWYEYGYPALSGIYAENIANLVQSDSAWSIAGTTYEICFVKLKDDRTREFCSKRAIRAFENAISLNPDDIEARINLAVCYVDNPDKDNPMQGILMLRELNQKYPENVPVLNQLGRLAIQTNQINKAIERLEAAIIISPENQNTICLLAEAYEAASEPEKAKFYRDKCVH